jgi:hypothetical protein
MPALDGLVFESCRSVSLEQQTNLAAGWYPGEVP